MYKYTLSSGYFRSIPLQLLWNTAIPQSASLGFDGSSILRSTKPEALEGGAEWKDGRNRQSTSGRRQIDMEIGGWKLRSIGLMDWLPIFEVLPWFWCAMIWCKENVRNFVSDPDPESSPCETLESMTQVDKRLKTSVVLVEHNAAITAAERSRRSCVCFHADVSPWITTPFIISPQCISRTILLGRHHYQYQLADIFHKNIISSFLCSNQQVSIQSDTHDHCRSKKICFDFWEVASMLKASLPKLGERPQPKVQRNEVRVLWFFRRRDRNVKTSWNHP